MREKRTATSLSGEKKSDRFVPKLHNKPEETKGGC